MGMMTAKQRRYAEAAESEIYGGVEPTSLSSTNYKLSLLKALNYYNVAVENKPKKKWVIDYYKKINSNISSTLDKLDDWQFHTLGALIRMKSRNISLSEKDELWVSNKISSLVEESNLAEEELKNSSKHESKQSVDVQKYILIKSREFASDIDKIIDNWYFSVGELTPLLDLLKSNNISKPVSSNIPKFYVNQIRELIEAVSGKDEQLNEGYSNIPKQKIKKLLVYLQSFKNDVDIYNISNKVRKVRVSKQKPPSVLVKNLKYLSNSQELEVKSVNVIDLIGSSKVWVYNTKYKKIIQYVGENISVKGTTLINFNPEISKSKTLRKPELLKSYISLSNKKLEMIFKEIKSSQKAPNGRINSDCLIFKVD